MHGRRAELVEMNLAVQESHGRRGVNINSREGEA